jgi:hypothetical protein
VAEALNKAVAIETLDSAIRQLDPTTREVVRSAYQTGRDTALGCVLTGSFSPYDETYGNSKVTSW